VSLTVRFWGTRGSVPCPGPATLRYGGNTPCLEVRTADGALIILDAGTGMRPLGRTLTARPAEEQANGSERRPTSIVGDLFLTHLHWDHIQGLPFFAPLYREEHRFTVWCPSTVVADAERVLRSQMSPGVFPVDFGQLRAAVEFRNADAGRVACTSADVRALPVRHPGGALGFRVAGPDGGALVYVPDNELDPAAAYDAPRDWRDRLVEFARGARLLVHDGMYTPAEHRGRRGWGHSTYTEALALAIDAGVETLALFHHDPERGDDALDHVVAECRAIAEERGGGTRVIAAAEGLELEV
jgi:phosphoribosyl 1,2-cyclic phosphodiesterase